MALAPAPEKTIRMSSRLLPEISAALSSAAPEMIAVPCWSSWNTGMSIRSRNCSSMTKHSGALMSSKLIPPKVGSIAATASMKAWVSVSSSSTSNTSMSANRLNSTPLPSMTGLEAWAPMSPSPRTAEPLEMTPTMLPFAVYSYASAGFSSISRHGAATPGEYASCRSRWVLVGLVVAISSFPGGAVR